MVEYNAENKRFKLESYNIYILIRDKQIIIIMARVFKYHYGFSRGVLHRLRYTAERNKHRHLIGY